MSEHMFDKVAWASQSTFWQMGNIGSEVGRALNGRRSGNEKRMMAAFYRGMDLINATIEAWVSQGKDPYELLIAREQFAKSILTEEVDDTLEQYFMDFAIAERSMK
ncbi:MAG: hypothetical protein WD061_01640 [Candidatus Saccharimonadales bacterium]